MNGKELANVLCKLLGLSVCVHTIVPIITLLFDLMSDQGGFGSGARHNAFAVSTVLTVAVGVVLIVKSRGITDLLFKRDAQ
jgi:hypothetical protein